MRLSRSMENAAQGFGHVGLGINNASTVGRRPQEPTLGVLFGDVPGEVSADSPGDDNAIVPTMPVHKT